MGSASDETFAHAIQCLVKHCENGMLITLLSSSIKSHCKCKPPYVLEVNCTNAGVKPSWYH